MFAEPIQVKAIGAGFHRHFAKCLPAGNGKAARYDNRPVAQALRTDVANIGHHTRINKTHHNIPGIAIKFAKIATDKTQVRLTRQNRAHPADRIGNGRKFNPGDRNIGTGPRNRDRQIPQPDPKSVTDRISAGI